MFPAVRPLYEQPLDAGLRWGYGAGMGHGNTVACTLALLQVDLASGESQTFDAGLVSAATIVGDSLPNGEYRITAYLRPGQIVELEAGVADLAAP